MTTGTEAGTLHTHSALLGAQSSPATASQRNGQGSLAHPHPSLPCSPSPEGSRTGAVQTPVPPDPAAGGISLQGCCRADTRPAPPGRGTGIASQPPGPPPSLLQRIAAATTRKRAAPASGRLRLERPSAQQGPSWEQPPTLSHHQCLSLSPRTHVVLPGTPTAPLRGQAPSQGAVQANSRAVLVQCQCWPHAVPQTPLLCTGQ